MSKERARERERESSERNPYKKFKCVILPNASGMVPERSLECNNLNQNTKEEVLRLREKQKE
jgi:hypothetical protein